MFITNSFTMILCGHYSRDKEYNSTSIYLYNYIYSDAIGRISYLSIPHLKTEYNNS